GGRKPPMPGEARLAVAQVLKRQGLGKLHRLDIIAAAVTINQTLQFHDFVKRDAILVIAAIWTVHDEAPDAGGPEIESLRRGGEAVRTPPLGQMFWIGEG